MIRQLLSFIKRNKLFSSTLASLVIRVSGLGLTLITTLLLTNMLSVAQYGVYAYILSITNLVILLVVLGNDKLLIRQSVVYVKQSLPALFRGLQLFSAGFVFSMTLLVVSAIWLLKPLLNDQIGLLSTALFGFFIALVAIGAGLRLMEGLVRGLHAPVSAQLPDQIIRRVGFLLLLIVFTAAGSQSIDARSALVAHILASVLALICALALAKLSYPNLPEVSGKRWQFETRSWLVSSATMGTTTIMQTVVTQLPIVFLGVLANAEAVAKYSVVVRVGSLLSLFLIAANMSIAGRIAGHDVTDDIEILQKLAQKSVRFACALASPVALIVFFYAGPILRLFGDEYAQGAYLLQIVTIGYMVHVGTGAAAIFLTMTGNEHIVLRISVAMFLFNVMFSGLMIYQFGSLGAIISFIASFLAFKVLIVVAVKRVVGVNTTILSFSR